MEKAIINVTGMSCAHCEKVVKETLTAINGVASAVVSLKDKTVTVLYDPEKVRLERINGAIEEVGFEAE